MTEPSALVVAEFTTVRGVQSTASSTVTVAGADAVRQALTYAAPLRFPADTDATARDARIEEVLAELGLTGHADQRITSLSGGQRKRTSVALELGHVAFFGAPYAALRYFGESDFADVFLLLATASGEEWAPPVRAVPGPFPQRSTPADSAGRRGPSRSGSPRRQRVLTQLAVLTRRDVAVIASDRQYAVFSPRCRSCSACWPGTWPGSTACPCGSATSRCWRQQPSSRWGWWFFCCAGWTRDAAATSRDRPRRAPAAQAGTSHSHAGSSASSFRIRSRPRLRVGPMLPIGIFNAVEIEA